MLKFFNASTYCRGVCMNEASYFTIYDGRPIFYCKQCRRDLE
jgi:hypothetical protein